MPTTETRIVHHESVIMQERARRKEPIGALTKGEVQHAIRVGTGVYVVDPAKPNEFTPPAQDISEDITKKIFQKSADTERKEIWQEWGKTYEDQVEHWKSKFSATVNQLKSPQTMDGASLQRLAIVCGKTTASEFRQQEFTQAEANAVRLRYFNEKGRENDKDLITFLKEDLYTNLSNEQIIKCINDDEVWLMGIASNLYGDYAALNRLNKFKFDMTMKYGNEADKAFLTKKRTEGKFNEDKSLALNDEQNIALRRLQLAKEEIDRETAPSPDDSPMPDNNPQDNTATPELSAPPPPIPNGEQTTNPEAVNLNGYELRRAQELIAPGTEREHVFLSFTFENTSPEFMEGFIKDATKSKSEQERLDYIYQLLLGRKLDLKSANIPCKEGDIANVIEQIRETPEYQDKQILATNLEYLYKQARGNSTTDSKLNANALRQYMTAITMFGLRPEEAFSDFSKESGTLNPEKVNAFYSRLLFREATDEEKKNTDLQTVVSSIRQGGEYTAASKMANVISERLVELLDTEVDLSLLEALGKDVMSGNNDTIKAVKTLLQQDNRTDADIKKIDEYIKGKINYQQDYKDREQQLKSKKQEWIDLFSLGKDVQPSGRVIVTPSETTSTDPLTTERRKKAAEAFSFWEKQSIDGKSIIADQTLKNTKFNTVQIDNILFIIPDGVDPNTKAKELIEQKRSLDKLTGQHQRDQEALTVLILPSNSEHISCADVNGNQVILSDNGEKWPHEAAHAVLANKIVPLVLQEAAALNLSRQVRKENNSNADSSYPIMEFTDKQLKAIYPYGDFLYWILMKEFNAYDENTHTVREANQAKVNVAFLTLYQELARQNLTTKNGNVITKDGKTPVGTPNQRITEIYKDLFGIDIGTIDKDNKFVKWYVENSERIRDKDKRADNTDNVVNLLITANGLDLNQKNKAVTT